MTTSTMTTSTALTIIIAPRLRAPRGGITVDGRDYRGGVYLPASARPVLEALAARAATVAGRDEVIIGICGFAYRLEPLTIDEGMGDTAFALHDTARNRVHHVHRDEAGEVVCDCGDFTFRRQGSGEPCKHGRRLVELGLIPATTPRVLPPFAVRPAVMPTWPTPTYRNRYEPSDADRLEAARMFA